MAARTAAALLGALLAAAAGGEHRIMIDFTDPGAPDWFPVNDGVMGGVSTGALTVTDRGTGLFAGEVSLENNGGFASVRTMLPEPDLEGAQGIVLKVRGDGRRYRLRLRTDAAFDGVAYQASFATAPDRWAEVALPLADFRPVFRGRPVPDAPPLRPADVRQLGLMIADKQAGPFALEIAWIKDY